MSEISVDQFKHEIDRCILLEDEEKSYWLHAADTLPIPLLERMYVFFKEKNDVIDLYVTKAIEADSDVVTDLKQKVQTLKKHVLQFKEAEEKAPEEAEKALEEALENL